MTPGLSKVQTKKFFDNTLSMDLQRVTITQLVKEGINKVEDLDDFDKEMLKQVANSLRKWGGMIQNLDPGAAAGSIIPQAPFAFGPKSQKRLLVALEL
eukprot:14229334-Ditylum_brightwellii.AAC.1